ncbi:geranylgeranyl pyrophosphate synthase [Halobacteroides halobius DSM 5150]|uniref:Geranylgeranyl pyrophosphate synthase n=1 Tax=Halobacteroides halobius (strain ATCC 35273 / DSM 5150 / MD-1) TaxID=748449 RepID=L0KC07_HALHC|nr:polyprenyl synthetase family protein [Halobacteroides halobius]AGB41899.1 geranylgeranyl pyrophosphate synthase [Halobacteroides halobius DSM 5150]
MFWDRFPIIKEEMVDFEEYLYTNLTSKQSLIQEAILDLAKAGGKRIRPALIMASAHFGDYDQDRVWNVAGAMEILHMATLIHDDIIDEARLRRGAKTTQAQYGKDTAVFTGDYLFSLTFNLLSGKATQKQLQKVADVIKQICEGEIQQHQDRYKLAISYKDYLKRIKSKTALLFESSCYLGADLANLSKLNIRRLGKYGRYLGMAFQLTDDLLDFKEEITTLGKPDTNDFTQGIYTLPILYVILETGYDDQLKKLIKEPVKNSKAIKEIVNKAGGLEYTLSIANDYIKKAKKEVSKLPVNQYQNLLNQLADEVIERNF